MSCLLIRAQARRMQAALGGPINARSAAFDGSEPGASIRGVFSSGSICGRSKGAARLLTVFDRRIRRRKEPHVHCPWSIPEKRSAPLDAARHQRVLGRRDCPDKAQGKCPCPAAGIFRPRDQKKTKPLAGHARGGSPAWAFNRGAITFRAKPVGGKTPINCGPRPLRLGGERFAQPCHRAVGQQVAPTGPHPKVDRHAKAAGRL